MNIYKISQTERSDWDTYDSAVVVAENPEAARKTFPAGYIDWGSDAWASSPEKVTVELIGVAESKLTASVICASFNAG